MNRLNILAAGLGLATALGAALPAAAADFVVVRREVAVARPADAVWATVGDYCAIKEWLKIDCVYSGGSGGVGATRRLNNGMVEEVMVGRTPYSYTYYQTVGGMAANGYHGTLDVQPVDARSSRIVYTLVYDQQPLDAAAKAANRARLEARFQGAIEGMKASAEAKR